MRLFYGQSAVLMPKGYSFRNARMFERIEVADAVMTDGDWPQIRAAYEAAGIAVAFAGGPAGRVYVPAKRRAKSVSSGVTSRPTTASNIVLD